MCYLLFLLIFFTLSNSCKSWSWFSSSSNSQNSETLSISTGFAAEFSVDGLRDEKGIERVVNAKIKLEGPKSCWYDAYQGLFTACSEITSDDNEKRKRFAWSLSNCFQKDSGRPSFPSCSNSSPMKTCLQKLDNNAIHTYRQFFLETNSICHQLQLSCSISSLLLFVCLLMFFDNLKSASNRKKIVSLFVCAFFKII